MMASFSGLGIGLSLVFGCLVLALFAELYYLLWWKKRAINNTEIEQEKEEELSTKYAKELFHLICWKKPNSEEKKSQFEEQDLELGIIKAFNGDESIESELMRLHNLSGPPRFLFTINEETKEDLESEDGKSSRKGSRTTSLSDLILAVDSPIHHHHGFNNPLFESSNMESEIRSSPPPKFKFLRDAEEKLLRRLMEEAENKARRTRMVTAETEGSFLGFIVGKNSNNNNNNNYNKGRSGESIFNQVPATSSQVLPLASSPTAFRPFDEKKPHN